MFLASFTSFLSGDIIINSISQSYHVGGWARDIFVGSLFAITAFLLSYNGNSTPQMISSKIAAIAAMGVAMFPCECEIYEEIIPNVHNTSAAVMFLVLSFFCYTFYCRARDKAHPQAKIRAYIYAVCGLTIVASILLLGFDHLSGDLISSSISRLTFYGERAGLVAFGIAWLTASRALPLLTTKEERLLPFSF